MLTFHGLAGTSGKNGEGKSTTMRLICGLHQPSSGTVQVLGTQLTPFTARHIQSQIALCPQENVIWPDLTCLEHLQILAKIRGVQVDASAGTLDEYLIHLLHDVYLGTRANEYAGTMSGGQKRKLCMAMALLGSPAVILLDEPTSNMDVYTRQHAWSLIQQARKHSTVIITSHSMEEIEQVSDYVALIKKGQVRVVGTPLWIKSKFCSGSRIVLLPDQSASAPFNAGKVLSVVRDHFGAAELIAHHPTSVLIHVPVPEGQVPGVHSEKAAAFLESWDNVNQEKQLGVAGISLSLIPLEDVFIKLNDEWDQEPDEDDMIPAAHTES
ncbi:P-loop containing nucleoside triphosphate hydrolase protein [Catenaria anguillulae PL171]|uniref:p-loop containing nucleoside triphosphate hydrolase protein n=1 Tax=Catenaria anguillulae PL171 TaxID=765915 RepID=A0A1Y2I6S8_9FUNG|nr:P-loop containing nucleoside triphosphate hydrolase protein [Catenaria anguillulae PL171]